MLIEPIEDGGFKSYAVVAEGMIRLDLGVCGSRVSGLLEDLEQRFAVLIRTESVSLNYGDEAILDDTYPRPVSFPLVPSEGEIAFLVAGYLILIQRRAVD